MTKPLRRVAAISLVLALAVVTVPILTKFTASFDPTSCTEALTAPVPVTTT